MNIQPQCSQHEEARILARTLTCWQKDAVSLGLHWLFKLDWRDMSPDWLCVSAIEQKCYTIHFVIGIAIHTVNPSCLVNKFQFMSLNDVVLFLTSPHSKSPHDIPTWN